MVDLDIEICACNDLSAKDIAKCIKENNFTTLDELFENEVCPMGDICKACRDDGFNNDGMNIPMVLSMVTKGLV